VILDTSVVIDVERRRMAGEARLLLLLPRDSYLAAIGVAEMLMGVEGAPDGPLRAARQRLLDRLLSRCPVLPFSIEEAHVYARLHVDLRTRGALIGERYLRIAATAIAGGHELLTHDLADFGRIPGLRVRTLPRN
jgi:tRNA(fMet)-specific endonuclease VapC